MRALLDVILIALNIYMWIVIAAVILSWLVAFNVVNTRHPFVAAIADFLYRITEPVLRPIRQRLPNMGGIDISPIIAWLIILFILWVILPFVADLIRSLSAHG
jgi:YggT family protein